jgi:hypothetical protein
MIFLQESPLVARFKSDRSPVGYWEVGGLSGGGKLEGIYTGNTNATLPSGQPSLLSWIIGGTTIQFLGEASKDETFSLLAVNNDFEIRSIVSGTATSSLRLEALPLDSESVRFVFVFNAVNTNAAKSAAVEIRVGETVYERSVLMVYNPALQTSSEQGSLDVGVIPKGTSIFMSFSSDFPEEVAVSVQALNLKLKSEGNGCNCPDKTRRAKANPSSTYTSEQKDRDWTESEAGTPDKCWHEIAVQLTVDPESYKVPTDYPFGKAEVDD